VSPGPLAAPARSTWNPAMARHRSWIPLAVILVVGTPAPSAAAEPRSVLIFAQNEPSFPAFQEEMVGLREVLSGIPGGVTYHIEHLASRRYGGPAIQERQGEWLREKYREVPVDLILAEGSEAVQFVLRNRAAWPGIPVVFLEVVAPFEQLSPVRGMTGHYMTLDAAGTVELARRLVPGTRTVALVA
jgi:hypothetical protein